MPPINDAVIDIWVAVCVPDCEPDVAINVPARALAKLVDSLKVFASTLVTQ